MEQMALFQEAALERLYRWTQAACRNVESPDSNLLLAQAIGCLQDHPVLLKSVQPDRFNRVDVALDLKLVLQEEFLFFFLERFLVEIRTRSWTLRNQERVGCLQVRGGRVLHGAPVRRGALLPGRFDRRRTARHAAAHGGARPRPAALRQRHARLVRVSFSFSLRPLFRFSSSFRGKNEFSSIKRTGSCSWLRPTVLLEQLCGTGCTKWRRPRRRTCRPCSRAATGRTWLRW